MCAQNVDQSETLRRFHVPIGPAVAGFQALRQRADPVDRADRFSECQRAVGANQSAMPPLGVDKARAGRDQSALDEGRERHARRFACGHERGQRRLCQGLDRVDAPARGKKPASKSYALDDGELTAILDKLRKEGVREGAWSISRFKGLGEMSAEQLWETTLNPDTRRLLPVQMTVT